MVLFTWYLSCEKTCRFNNDRFLNHNFCTMVTLEMFTLAIFLLWRWISKSDNNNNGVFYSDGILQKGAYGPRSWYSSREETTTRWILLFYINLRQMSLKSSFKWWCCIGSPGVIVCNHMETQAHGWSWNPPKAFLTHLHEAFKLIKLDV